MNQKERKRMDRQQENAQARYLKRGFGWKRFSNISEGSDEEKRMLKSIIHDYPDLKNYCRFFETKRRSIIVMAGLEGEDTTFLNTEKLKDLLALPMNEDDKRKLYAYFDASTKIMALELGMEGLPDGRYKGIVQDKYFKRLSYIQLMEKYGVSRETVHRALKRANGYLLRYARWYL